MKAVLILLAIATVAASHGYVPVYQPISSTAYPQYQRPLVPQTIYQKPVVPQTIYQTPKYYYPQYQFVYPNYGSYPIASTGFGNNYYYPIYTYGKK